MVKHVQHSHVPLEIDALAQLDRLDQREIAGVYHGIPQAIAGGIAVRTIQERLGFRSVDNEMNRLPRYGRGVSACVQTIETQQGVGGEHASGAKDRTGVRRKHSYSRGKCTRVANDLDPQESCRSNTMRQIQKVCLQVVGNKADKKESVWGRRFAAAPASYPRSQRWVGSEGKPSEARNNGGRALAGVVR
jgi:hypothetical protein